MAQIEVKDLARDNWPTILTKAGIEDSFLSKKHGPCPVCAGTDRYRFIDKDGFGTFFCSHCGSGDGLTLLMKYKGVSFAEAAAFVREALGGGSVTPVIRHRPDTTAADLERRAKVKARLQKTWDIARPVKRGDPVWKYLALTRKLPIDNVPSVIRFHPRFPFYEEAEKKDQPPKLLGKFPMMLAKVQDKTGMPVGLHRTYLSQDGLKANVPEPKKLMEGLGVSGCAVHLYPAGEVLAITEGIETAIAVHALTGQPVWACISSTIMERFDPPDCVKTLIIYADNDQPDSRGRRAGQEAANNLAIRLREKGLTVRIVLPMVAGTDFHDVWCKRLETRASHAKARQARVRAA